MSILPKLKRELRTVENDTDGTLTQAHVVALPECCPRSHNPRLGSAATIRYTPQGRSIEIGSLYAYINQYKGGLYDVEGNLVVRDMEGMIQRIAYDCAQAVGPVVVAAHLVLLPRQEMDIVARGYPEVVSA